MLALERTSQPSKESDNHENYFHLGRSEADYDVVDSTNITMTKSRYRSWWHCTMGGMGGLTSNSPLLKEQCLTRLIHQSPGVTKSESCS